MGFWELFAIGVGLSMDAFAVSVCKGLSAGRARPGQHLATGAWFGGFQVLMPLLGFLLGVRFQAVIASVDHWIAFVLLASIGGKMIWEAMGEQARLDGDFGPRSMLPLAVATSIDALAVGVTFAFLRVQIVPAVALIGCITFCLSALGVWVGAVFGSRFQKRAEITGGMILILMGLKILLEHLGVLG